MGDEQTAATLASDDTKTDALVTDGVVDLDAPQEVKEETTEGKTENADAKGDGETGEPPKKPSGAQRAKIREARLLAENAELNRKVEELARNAPAKTDADEAKPPEEKDFNGDYFAWQRALTAFEAGGAARKAVREEFKTVAESRRTEQQAEIARERDVAHLERVEDAREVIADFDKVMEGMKGVNVRDELIAEIKGSEHSAVIAYHLAKNPDKLNAMNQMSGRELAREMGRLEATVRLPEAKRQTSAPPPLTPVKGGAGGSFDPTKASMSDYIAKRKAGWSG